MSNPFFYGPPVNPSQFQDRRKAIGRVVGRILNGGQSTAIVGEPRMGKTSLLEYLVAPENRGKLYREQANSLVFNMIDAQMFSGEFSQRGFWELALTPLAERINTLSNDMPIVQHYEICRQNQFGTFTLERLFKQLQKEKWCLVLLLDEFDVLLHHPVLNSAEFFGSLRGLISGSKGALTVVTASRQSLATLNAETQKFNPTGSPYFNIFAEVKLKSLKNRDVTTLLNRADDLFSTADRQYIHAVAGGHPYLLQLAASAMWDEIIEGSSDIHYRYLAVEQRIRQETRSHFSDTWRFWSPAMRKAFTSVALGHAAHLLPHRAFLSTPLVKGLRDFGPELDDLEVIGLIARDEGFESGWRVVPQAMLWWLAEELMLAVRDDTSFEEWLRAQELDGLLTQGEKELLGNIVRRAFKAFRERGSTLVEGFVKGLGEGLGKGLTGAP